MKRTLAVMVLLATTAVAGATMAYQAAARERQYRVLLGRGDAALGGVDTFAAIEAYSGAIALRPDSMLAHLRRGETYSRRGDLDAAVRDFRTAAALDPSATRPLDALGDVLYQRERFARAAAAYEARLRLDDRSARLAYKLALARYRDGNIDGAQQALGDAIQLNDQLPDAHYLLGLCLREKRQMSEALEAFERAVALSPVFLPAREELAELYSAVGRRADELEQLQIIAGLDREHVERQIAVALAQARGGQPELAVLTLGNLLERAPDQPLIYGALGRVWLDMAIARNDQVFLSKALAALERNVSTGGAASDVMTLYGRALLRDNQVEAAERVLQQATQRFPVDPAAFLAYAAAAERQGHLQAARAALIAYGSLASEDRSAFAARAARIGTLYVRMHDPAVAVTWFERAADAKPGDHRLLAALADAQLRAGNRARAGRSASGLETEAAQHTPP